MSKEAIEKAKKALIGELKKHEKLKEIGSALPKEKPNLETEIAKPLTVDDMKSVKREFGVTAPILKQTEPNLEQNIDPMPMAPKKEEKKTVDKPYMPRRTENPMSAAAQEKRQIDYEPTVLNKDFKITRPGFEVINTPQTDAMKRSVQNFMPEGTWGGMAKEVNDYVETKRLDHEKSKVDDKKGKKVDYEPTY